MLLYSKQLILLDLNLLRFSSVGLAKGLFNGPEVDCCNQVCSFWIFFALTEENEGMLKNLFRFFSLSVSEYKGLLLQGNPGLFLESSSLLVSELSSSSLNRKSLSLGSSLEI